ncbi:MAG: alpha/beta hydrolase [Cyanobacteria bacterium P01_F01_bin.150]
MAKQKHSRIRQLLLGDFTVKRLVRSLLFIYLFFMAYVFVTADRMIFLPPQSSYTDTPEIIKVIEPSSSQAISATYLPALLPSTADGDSRPEPLAPVPYTILYSHGNAEDLGLIRPVLHMLQDAGLSVFAYDYPGYGTSEGTATERSAYRAIAAVYTYLTDTLQVPADHIIVYGRSVGGGPSTYLAARNGEAIAGLILESTFTSAFRTVIPFPILPFDKFPNARNLQQFQGPTLIMHGTDDQIITFDHGKTLFEIAHGEKQFFPVEGAGHNDLVWVAGDRYLEVVQSFVQRLKTDR